MKKFIIFILVLLSLIAAEYYFLTEIFTLKRTPVMIVSLAAILACLYIFIRFFKKTVISS